ncbi:PH domain-containing protein [Halorientalis persicus]|nr:PH domain-containing protein [Halorientalis persicus]
MQSLNTRARQPDQAVGILAAVASRHHLAEKTSGFLLKWANNSAMDSPPSWLEVDSADQVLYSGHPSPFVLVPEGIATVVVSLITSYVISEGPLAGTTVFGHSIQFYLAILLALSILLLGYMELRRRFTQYVVTTQGVYKKTGIIGRDPDFIPIRNLQAMDWNQNPLERMVGIGDVMFFSASAGHMSTLDWSYVPDPSEAGGLIEDQLSGLNVEVQRQPPGTEESTEGQEQQTQPSDDDGGTQRSTGDAASATAEGATSDGAETEDSAETPRGFH